MAKRRNRSLFTPLSPDRNTNHTILQHTTTHTKIRHHQRTSTRKIQHLLRTHPRLYYNHTRKHLHPSTFKEHNTHNNLRNNGTRNSRKLLEFGIFLLRTIPRSNNTQSNNHRINGCPNCNSMLSCASQNNKITNKIHTIHNTNNNLPHNMDHNRIRHHRQLYANTAINTILLQHKHELYRNRILRHLHSTLYPILCPLFYQKHP